MSFIRNFEGNATRHSYIYAGKQRILNPYTRFVRRMDSAIHRIVIFFNYHRGIKAMTPGILDSQEIKSDFNSKMPNCNMGFTHLPNMFTKFETKHHEMGCAIHISYNRARYLKVT